MSNDLAAAVGSGPKFYYGAGKIRGVGRSFRPCILDLRDGSLRLFNLVTDLRRAVEALISVVGAERERQQTTDLPGEGISFADQLEEFEDQPYVWEEREDENRRISACNLSSRHLTKRGELRNLRRDENTHLFFQKEEEERLLALRAKLPQGSYEIRKRILARESWLHSAVTGASQQAAELRNFDELESAEKGYGPYYQESDFTSDPKLVPKKLREKFSLLDLNLLSEKSRSTLAQAEVIRAEVSIAFHPEAEESILGSLRRSHGLTGNAFTGSADIDVMLTEIKR